MYASMSQQQYTQSKCRAPWQVSLLAPLFALLLVPVGSAAQTIVRGPYLQTASPISIIIKWRTDIATDSSVAFAVVDGVPLSVSSVASTTEHEVTLSGLSPATRYNYTVGSTIQVLAGGDINTNGDGEHFFYTPPTTGTDKSTRVWVIGDSGTADANSAAVRDAYKSFTGNQRTDVWLMLGDNAYESGTDAEYQAAVFNTYPQLLRQVPLWSAFGNHDGIDVFFNPPGAYPQIFSFPTLGESGGVNSGSETYYSFNFGNIHFISLDAVNIASYQPGSDMLLWLQADLLANTQEWTIAFWHHPPYSKGSHDSDIEIVLIEMRENVVPLLESYGVDLVLTGHSHSYERSYLMNGHYGDSESLDVGGMILDGSDGNEFGEGAYVKPGPAGTPNEGTVYAVVGSSGKLGGGTLDHPIMYTSMNVLGSMVLDVSGNQLDAVFIDSAGIVQDEFTIIKSPPQVVDIDVDPWDAANEVKPASNDNIGVAILGLSIAAGDTVDFDATQVDPATLKLGIGEAPAILLPWVTDIAWVTDIDGDSEMDVILAFQTQETSIFCGDTEVSLEGETFTGDAFIATDSITTVECEICHP